MSSRTRPPQGPAPDAAASTALAGKLSPPLLAAYTLPRDALHQALDAAPPWKVLLLRAPAGYGKTTLMGQLFVRLARDTGMQCHWLTLDPRDDDPCHLLIHLQAAVHLRLPPSVQGVPDLGAWLNAVARMAGRQVLFLDEMESVSAPVSIQLIQQLLRFAPDNLRIVVGTRPGAAPGLPRLKAGGDVLQWSARQLRFDDDEAGVLLQRSGAAHAPAEWLQRITQRCEGWPAALRLSALALTHAEAAPRVLDVLQDERSDLADYLAGEIFDLQPPAHRAFMLDTCILRYLLPPLCDALREQDDSTLVLQEMERNHQFVVPLGHGQGGAWRYHSLLQAFLRKRLDTLFPGRAAALHRKAAAWLESQNLPVEAIGHALECGDPAFAAAMMERSARPLVRSGHLATLQQWIRRLPAHVADVHPGIVWAAGRAHTYFHQIEEARVRLRQLSALADGQALDRAAWEDYLALEALISAVADDIGRSMEVTARNLPLAKGDYARGIMLNVRANGEIALNRFDEALASLDQADIHNRKASNLFGLSAGLGLRAAIWSSRGELRQALACYAVTGPEGQAGSAARHEHTALGSGLHCELLYETDRLDELQAALALHAPHEDTYLATDLVIGGHLSAARLQFARGERSAALASVDEALARSLQRRFHRLAFACRWERVRMATLSGRLRQAVDWVPATTPQDASFHFATDTEACDIAWLRLQLRQGQARQVLPRIEQLLAQAQATQRGWRALKLSILHACALDALGRTQAARAILAAALGVGSRHGFVRSFADEGAPVLDPIEAWLSGPDGMPAGVPREYAQQVLAAGRTRTPVPAAEAGAPGSHVLSERERALLQALAQGRQNKEIARRLLLSENTVKWHLKRLYAKLDARNRAQAIVHAQRLNLVE